MTRLLLVLLAAAFALPFVACSDDDDEGTKIDCSFEPCGGDPVGTWSIRGTCGSSVTPGIPQCADSVYRTNLRSEGTVTFDADGTYQENIREFGTEYFVLDDDCVTASTGGMFTAEAFCALTSLGPAMPGSGVTGSCDYAGGKCICDLTYDDDWEYTDNYVVSGNTLTLSWDEFEFCVEGDTLKTRDGDTVVVYERK